VETPIEKRFELSKKRDKAGDPQSFDDFKQADLIELGNITASHSQQLAECFKLSQYTIDNDSTLEMLEEKVTKLYEDLYTANCHTF
jgi:dephospho-CoA kinase